jgi:hypothetical protein
LLNRVKKQKKGYKELPTQVEDGDEGVGHHDEVGQVEEHPHHQAGEAVLREQDETEHKKTLSVLPPVLWIRIIGFNADPDLAILVDADPDAGPYPGF